MRGGFWEDPGMGCGSGCGCTKGNRTGWAPGHHLHKYRTTITEELLGPSWLLSQEACLPLSLRWAVRMWESQKECISEGGIGVLAGSV